MGERRDVPNPFHNGLYELLHLFQKTKALPASTITLGMIFDEDKLCKLYASHNYPQPVTLEVVMQRNSESSTVACQTDPSPAVLTFHMSIGLCSNCFTLSPVPCYWPGNAEEGRPSVWAPVLMRIIQKSFSDWPSSRHCSYLRNETVDGRCLSLCLCLSFSL